MRAGIGASMLRAMNQFTTSDRLRWLAVTVIVAAVAIPLSFILWKTPAGVAAPPPSMLPFLLPIEVVIPALALGLGVAFILFGRKLLQGSRPSALSRAAFVSIWWLLVNWWPHSNFHRVSNGWVNLVVIDYFFHASVIVATCVVAAFFLSAMLERQAAGQAESPIGDLGSSQAVGSGSSC
jgi:hypothetical protein